MKLKIKQFLTLVLLLIAQVTLSQERFASGVVTNAEGAPLPSVNVTVKGTTRTVYTGFDGAFKIEAKEEEILVFSFLGMRTIERSVKPVMEVSMSEEKAIKIIEVVVTAFGIKRKPKDIGYSVSNIKSTDVTENSEPDLLRSLSGKVAGVNVDFSTGVAGAANNITIRGINTLTGNITPLFIVDGISYSNIEVESSSQNESGGGYQSGIASLDPNDIKSIDVLKSTAASALYGSRAANGVVVITTKSGSSIKSKKNELSVTVGLGTYFENIANLPEYQNTYGAGNAFSYTNLNGSWGPRFDTVSSIPTWPSLLEAFPEFGATMPYKAQPNNVKNLFKTGIVSDKTFGLNFSGENGSFGLTASKLDQDSYIPFNTFDRTSIAIGGNYQATEKFSFGANSNYSKTNQTGPFFGDNQFDGSSSSFARTLYLARNWDFSLPYKNPITGASISPLEDQFDHPLWAWEHDQIKTITHRIITGINFEYVFNKNISAKYRLGFNRYDLGRDEIRDLKSRAANGLGSLQRDRYINDDLESIFMINLNYKLNKKINFEGIIGNNIFQNTDYYEQNLGTEFILPKIFTLNNNKNIINLIEENTKKRNVGWFADVTFSYNKYFFINATGRNDWSSAFIKENNSYFYPSLSGSFIVTDAFKIKSNLVNYIKLRGGYAKVGRDAPSEFINNRYILGTPYNGNPLISNSTTRGDLYTKPEFTSEIDFGAELEFFNTRVKLDLSMYNRTTTDAISPALVPTSSGYTTLNSNIGELENKGIEATLTIVPVRKGDFKWTIFSVFTKNENKVTKIGTGDGKLNLRTNTPSYAIEGEPFGVFYGSKYARDPSGNYLIDKATGGIIKSPEMGIIGNPNADFKMSFTNTLSYKGLSLKGQIDWKQGGDIYSSTINELLGRGVTKDTEDRERTTIIPGFYGNSNGTLLLDPITNAPIPNTTQLTENELYFSPNGSYTFGINSLEEGKVYDGTVYRLRELSLAYSIPTSVLKSTPFEKVSISVVGNNLWYFAPNLPRYTNFDPEVTSFGSGNVQGVELNAAPTAKRYGFKINLTF